MQIYFNIVNFHRISRNFRIFLLIFFYAFPFICAKQFVVEFFSKSSKKYILIFLLFLSFEQTYIFCAYFCGSFELCLLSEGELQKKLKILKKNFIPKIKNNNKMLIFFNIFLIGLDIVSSQSCESTYYFHQNKIGVHGSLSK